MCRQRERFRFPCMSKIRFGSSGISGFTMTDGKCDGIYPQIDVSDLQKIVVAMITMRKDPDDEQD